MLRLIDPAVPPLKGFLRGDRVRKHLERTLGEMTPFDFVVFLLIGSVMQRALTGQDFSFTNAVLIVFTLVGLDVLFSLGLRDIPPQER